MNELIQTFYDICMGRCKKSCEIIEFLESSIENTLRRAYLWKCAKSSPIPRSLVRSSNDSIRTDCRVSVSKVSKVKSNRLEMNRLRESIATISEFVERKEIWIHIPRGNRVEEIARGRGREDISPLTRMYRNWWRTEFSTLKLWRCSCRRSGDTLGDFYYLESWNSEKTVLLRFLREIFPGICCR